MTLQLVEDAYGDVRNARFLAVASDLAYFPQDQGGPAFKEHLGLEAVLSSVGNTQAYEAHNDDHIVVAFRGTESPTTIDGLKDWLVTNAANFLILPEGRMGTDFAAAGVGARFHQGFINAIVDIWQPVFDKVQAERTKNDRPLWLTGHSLGGALALLAAWLFQRKFVPVHQIYTFGGPMIGNDQAAKAINLAYPNKIFRYVDLIDPIPRLPTVSLADSNFIHCDCEVGLGTVTQGVTSAAEHFAALASGAVSGMVHATLADDIWKAVQARLSAHSLENYKKRIASQ
jgi:triacylglycerol lipase